MKIWLVLFCALLAGDTSIAQNHKKHVPFPAEIVIGRNSFIDIGPPFNYYDLTFLRSDGDKTDIEQVSLTPPSDLCYPRAEVKVAHVKLDESLSSLLQGVNPCLIPEKRLNTELKRRTKGSVFSGMNVTIQLQCGGGTRLIRADTLDRDIFEEHPNTPQYTAWSKTLFEKLDKATGQSPWDKPIFAVSDQAGESSSAPDSAALQAIADGKFDGIFGRSSDAPSQLYQSAKSVPRRPSIELAKSDPVRPAVYVDPMYPPIARAAHVEGTVDFHLTIASNGSAEGITVESGPRMLWKAVSDAIGKWKFSPVDSGKAVQGSVRFELNCFAESK